MRGGFTYGRRFTAHTDDVKRFDALPWWKQIGGFERWLRRQYGDAIYRGGSYPR